MVDLIHLNHERLNDVALEEPKVGVPFPVLNVLAAARVQAVEDIDIVAWGEWGAFGLRSGEGGAANRWWWWWLLWALLLTLQHEFINQVRAHKASASSD